MTPIFPYTPRKAGFEALKETFVAREPLLNEIISNIMEQSGEKTLQHWMILGMRGMGKSHLITLIYYMVKAEERLNSNWLPVLMNEEEQGVFSLHTLFARILTKLGEEISGYDKTESERIHSLLETLRDGAKNELEILDSIISYLKEYAKKSKKSLLVLLENADELFEKSLSKENDVKKFRKILQHENFMLLLATSPTFFAGISTGKAPFYNFFKIRWLKLLDYDQSIRLLNRWAQSEGPKNRPGISSLEFKKDDYRLKALYHLTGGNPRILLFLYMTITKQGGIETAVDTFSTLLEEDLSNYYLSRMRDLSNQVQPIVIELAETDQNLTQMQISKRTFLNIKSIGTAMVRLENEGIVRPVSEKKGKNTLYTLTDHLFRLWYRWRTGIHKHGAIESIVEFLAIWFKREELETWGMDGNSLTGKYAKEAIDFIKSDKFLIYQEIFRDDAGEFIQKLIKQKQLPSVFETLTTLKGWGIDTKELQGDVLKKIKNLGVIDEAEKYLKERLKTHPEDGDSCLLLGKILLQKKDNSGAEELFDKVTQINPENFEAWTNLAIARLNQENYPGAEEAFSHAVELDPNNSYAWYFLGIARLYRQKYSGAEEAFSHAVKLDPNNVDAWVYLSTSSGYQKNYTRAEKASSHAVKLDPNNAGAWYNLGLARLNQENYPGAEEAFSHAVKLEPNNAGAWNNLGLARLNQENYPGTEEAISRAVEIDPNNAGAWNNLGFARFSQQNYLGAEDALSHAIKLEPNNASAWNTLGLARLYQENFLGVEEAFFHIVKLDPNNAGAWNNLGLARFSQQNYPGAEDALSHALKLYPKNFQIPVLKNLSAAQCKNYRFKKATDNLLRIIEINDKETDAYFKLCELYMWENDTIDPSEILQNAQHLKDATDEFRVSIHFLSALVFLNKGEKPIFKKNLEAGIGGLIKLSEEKRHALLGKMINLFVEVMSQGNIQTIRAFVDSFKETGREYASVLDPIHYFLDFFNEYFSAQRDKKISVIKAHRVLDSVPLEIRTPVEEMINKAKENLAWWEKQPS